MCLMRTVAAMGLAMMMGQPVAHAQAAQSGWESLDGWTPIADLRLRYEDVGQVPIAEDAEALTLRARLGVQTRSYWDTALLVEGNFLLPFDDRYRTDGATTYNSRYPLVADPRDHELNRLALINTAIPDTTVTLGRQRIQLDDQRFIGNVGWRQDEQTFDAVRVVNRSIPDVTFDMTYSDRVHRVYTEDSPQ